MKFVVVLASFAFFLAACTGTEPLVDAGEPDVADSGTPPPDDGGTPPVDAGTPPVDAGAPPVDAGAPPVDAGAPPVDAGAPAGPAANLGVSCRDAPCPNGEPCFVATGRCTISCPELGTIGGCDEGYPGPGFPYCGGGPTNDPGCIIGCGQQNGGDLSCPHGMVCTGDADNNNEPDTCENP